MLNRGLISLFFYMVVKMGLYGVWFCFVLFRFVMKGYFSFKRFEVRLLFV